jgi:hypothetical protein
MQVWHGAFVVWLENKATVKAVKDALPAVECTDEKPEGVIEAEVDLDADMEDFSSGDPRTGGGSEERSSLLIIAYHILAGWQEGRWQ